MIAALHRSVLARWFAMDRGARGAALVSLGSITLVVMAMLVKQVGSHIPAIEILFFRSCISGQGLITHGWTLGDVTALVPLDYSRIVYSAVLGFFIFGELPGLWSLAGMAVIVASSLYLVLTERRR